MRVALCCLAKNENLYINDFVSWYVRIGIDTIYIFDNNEKEMDTIDHFIDSKYHKNIKVIDIMGLREHHLQQHIYTDFYHKYKNDFDWCLFVDIDEFLVNVPNIKSLLSSSIYNRFNQIRIMWRVFGDDNLISRDMSKPVFQVFKKPISHSLMRDLKTKGNLEKQGKFILRGHLNNVNITSPHFASYGNRDLLVESCLPNGEKCFSKVVINEPYYRNAIYINHYMTKSLSEFIDQKLNRNDAVYNYNINMNYYWRINQKTFDKLQYIKKRGIKI